MQRECAVREGLLLLAVILGCISEVTAQTSPAEDATVTWDQVRSVFQKRCFACHRGEQARGGLDLSTVAGIRAGSTSGAAVVPGKPEQSMVYTLAAHLENPNMPPNSPRIPQRELDLLQGWIAGGLSEKTSVNAEEAADMGRTRPVRPRTIAAVRSASARSADYDVIDRTKPLTAAMETTRPDPPRRIQRQTTRSATQAESALAPAITALTVSPTASLAAVSGHHEVLIYEWTDRRLLRVLPFPEGDVFTLKFSRDGQLLLAGGGVGASLGKVVAFDVSSGERVFEIGGESDVVLAADISPDGRLVAMGGPGRTVRLFDSVTGKLISEMTRHTDWVTSLSFSHDGLLLATGDRFGSVCVWEAESGAPFHILRGHSGAVSSIMWSSDSSQLITAGQDGMLRSWDMHQGELLQQQDPGAGGILAADGDATGMLACGGRNRRILIRRLTDAEKDHAAASPADQISHCDQITTADEVVQLAVTHDSTHLIAADAAGRMRLYDLKTGTDVGGFVLPATVQGGQ